MYNAKQGTAARAFAEYWKNKGYEKGESQPFWLELLMNVFGVENPAHYIKFEEKVRLDNTSFIDGYIPSTHVLIEQKGRGKSLRKPIKQSDGSLLSPFQQAQRYSAVLPYSHRPRWIITCNFEEFLIYDMERPSGEPESVLLESLEKEYYRLNFLVNEKDESIKKEMEISVQAGELVGLLYDELLKQYINPENEESLKSLNQLCVRLVFCLYAEDAGIFGGHSKFHDYLKAFPPKNARKALIELFEVLNTKPEERDPYLDEALAEFPYVNGGLFADESIEIPQLNEKIVSLMLEKASEDFDWSGISPTIFGAVFESTLNPQTRRSGGMHYTSVENIHKVIDPLFLDDLKAELEEIKGIKIKRTLNDKLEAFRKKLGGLKLLDPAAGSGNFLTETYISLRKLENEALKLYVEKGQISGQIQLGDDVINPIEVSIKQFYGIEINDFAVTVAKTALWIAESQMMAETENIIHQRIDFLPLKSYANIVEGNALRLDWNEVVPKEELNYIMGNPPFVGKKEQTQEQKSDLKLVFDKKIKGIGKLDYVAGWYIKASDYIKNTNIECAFVSTNSICQGEQVIILWKPLTEKGINISFAHKTFKWNSEASENAAVHCVIIGFSYAEKENKKLFRNDNYTLAKNINPYLLDGTTVFIENRNKCICYVPPIMYGSMPIDNGYLILSKEDVELLLAENKDNSRFIRKYIGGVEMLHSTERWCLWLNGISPKELKDSKLVMERLKAVRDFRSKSNRQQTKMLAETPAVFGEIRQPNTSMLVIPKVSSENRKYIPISFVSPEIIVNGSALIIPEAKLYHFGILNSNVHNAWMRAVCGRLEMRYQYSGSIVYNNFPWCSPTEEQKQKIEQTAQAILDARALYPECSLADLYDELTMPPELRRAHQDNDRAVMRAYGFDVKTMTENECVAELMKMYKDLTNKN